MRIPFALVCVLIVAAASRPQATTQTFDQPAPGARSPRNANYQIDVRLDPATRTVSGRERIVWRNISNRSTRELQFHLYWNAFRDPSSTWLSEARLLAKPVVLERD